MTQQPSEGSVSTSDLSSGSDTSLPDFVMVGCIACLDQKKWLVNEIIVRKFMCVGSVKRKEKKTMCSNCKANSWKKINFWEKAKSTQQ